MPNPESPFALLREDYDDLVLSHSVSSRFIKSGEPGAAETNWRFTRQRFVEQRGFSPAAFGELRKMVQADYEAIEAKVNEVFA